MNNSRWLILALAVLILGGSPGAMGRGKEAGERELIRSKGSDTLSVLGARWAAGYQAQTPGVTVEHVSGGSGSGVASLINGHVELAASSRPLKSLEIRQIVSRSGKQPVLFLVGLDALSVVVHPLNPLHGLSLAQLEEIYGRDGEIRRWKDLGVVVPGCEDQDILPVSRKNNSGTYYLLREILFNHQRHFRIGMATVENSTAVVQRVAQTPCAIGYVGMGFVTAAVKTLCITKEGGSCVPPTAAAALEKRYPLARPLYMVALGPPSNTIKRYVEWILGPTGQEILKKTGFIPVPKLPGEQKPF
ncbi:MAG: phosphate ABC transporter substrate-binding protein [Magnetococcales bacterium]|nr:phosphate ABC transporter substrate-binding protein [Magnetococcales bacterium]